MKKFLFVLLVCCGLISGCQNEKTKKNDSIEHIKQDKEIEKLFSEYKYRFHQLMKGEYFRSRLTKNDRWIIEIEELNQKAQGKLYKLKNVSFAELKELALAYGESKGKETEYIILTKNKIKKHLAPDEIEKKELDEIFDKSTFSINLSSNDINAEIDKVIKRYNLIHKLNKAHFALRDTLRPFFWEICPKYYQLLGIKDSLEKPKVDSIINLLNSNKTNQNNLFVNEILNQKRDTSLITIEKAIAPVFNLKKDSVGIYNSHESFADKKLLQKTNFFSENSREAIVTGKINKTILYDDIIDEIKTKKIFIYSTTKKYESEISKFGKYAGVCLNYYYYDCKIDSLMKNEKKYLFASKYNLNLEYINNKKIDSLINLKNATICYDCLTNWDSQKTFAKLKGYENLYFSHVIYENIEENEVFTPIRALHYVNGDIVIRLWADSIDLFGCSCL